jgi:hypothetical protein
VLRESGFSAADVDLPVRSFNDPFDQQVYARTIHPDGVIIPYAGKPLEQTDSDGRSTRVITLPSVTVGSILEYGYHFRSLVTFYTSLVRNLAPHWVVQQRYFVCAAHYQLDTSDIDPKSVRWVAKLPEGVEIKRIKNSVELNLADVPALPEEEFMRPPSARQYSISFFYWAGTRESYWGTTGKTVDDYWRPFYEPGKTLTASVNQIISPDDTDEKKLRKLYDTVMALENTDLTRERSRREDKASGLKEAHNSDDIWLRKRGSSGELAMLYIALARAAGFQAYPMAVPARDGTVFNEDVLNWTQLDDVLALVVVNGRELLFDPGTRYCPFGQLVWWHSNVGGMSFEGKQLKFRSTPQNRIGAQTQRSAELKLGPEGTVDGTVTVVWNNIAALSHRRQFIREDQQAVETAITNSLQNKVPDGVQLKLLSLKGLDTYNDPLVATFGVSGKLGVSTGKRLVVPAEFFAGRDKPVLSTQIRTQDIAFPEVYGIRDAMRIELPASMAVEALPEAKNLQMSTDSGYLVRAVAADGKVLIQRGLYLKRLDYTVQEYGTLHKYFGDIANSDQNSLVLRTVAQ